MGQGVACQLKQLQVLDEDDGCHHGSAMDQGRPADRSMPDSGMELFGVNQPSDSRPASPMGMD